MQFDSVATGYDKTFTDTRIGQLQRKYVHSYLDEFIRTGHKGRVLELNAGTGEDAIYFASKGWQVLATDISPEMINVAQNKCKSRNFEGTVDFKVCDIRKLEQLLTASKFDLVFSNFGGLNCIDTDDLNKLAIQIAALLKPGGRFIAVVMPTVCLWENIYFLVKLNYREAFRRKTKQRVLVPVGKSMVETWYYNPEHFMNCFIQFFKRTALQPIGISIPPSYLEPFFRNKHQFLNFLDKMENILNKIPPLAYLSDHYLIELQPA